MKIVPLLICLWAITCLPFAHSGQSWWKGRTWLKSVRDKILDKINTDGNSDDKPSCWKWFDTESENAEQAPEGQEGVKAYLGTLKCRIWKEICDLTDSGTESIDNRQLRRISNKLFRLKRKIWFSSTKILTVKRMWSKWWKDVFSDTKNDVKTHLAQQCSDWKAACDPDVGDDNDGGDDNNSRTITVIPSSESVEDNSGITHNTATEA